MNVMALKTARNPQSLEAVSPDDVRLGKDVLELVSTAMYLDPMAVYREYVQNAADAIDEARAAGLLKPEEAGRIDISVDSASRCIRISDNGVGIPPDTFVSKLTALGASGKRGTAARGFRGVGRLAGLGYVQELVFRSRAPGQPDVSELRWDCRRLRSGLADGTLTNVAELIAAIATYGRVPADGRPDHFFEVEMVKVVRQRGDKLMDAAGAAEYLSQVAPVPFASEFAYGADIKAALASQTSVTELAIAINGGEPLTRPHRNELALKPGKSSPFEDLSVVEIPGLEGSVAAIGWFLHHGYEGAIPNAALVKGVRLRVGNLQVGDHTILEAMFPEVRFNSWSVGEVHILDPRIVPNGRRDHFEQNAHFNNLLNQLGPTAREIARRCRTNSSRRSKLRQFELTAQDVRERIEVLRQGGLDDASRDNLALAAETALMAMDKLAGGDLLVNDRPDEMRAEVEQLRKELGDAAEAPARSPLERLPVSDREMYERMFALIYECSVNQTAARALVDRILLKVGSNAA